MSKKHRTMKTAGSARGKKEKRCETNTGSTPNDDDFDEILESYAEKSCRIDTSIALFLLGSFVALAAALWPYFDAVGVNNHQRRSTNSQTVSDRSSSRRTSLSELFHIACKKTKLVYCEKGVFEIDDENRSIRTRSTIDNQKAILKRGQLLLSVPKSAQTTTLDALRDERVNRLLRQNPRHIDSEKPLHPKTFLAVYMAFELSQLAGFSGVEDLSPEGQLQRAYLEYLPTHQDFLQFHPISKQFSNHREEEGNPLLPTASLTDHFVDQYSRYYLSEYNALCRVSVDFQNHISLEDWITSRLIVQSRSFEVDPLIENDIGNQELETYRPFLVDHDDSDAFVFYERCRKTLMRSTMVPLLDALDHHQSANVGWQFMESESSLNSAKSFINYATQDIYSNSHVSHSYYSSSPEPLVFAHYGFVNPYGTGDRAALLAPYHRLRHEEFESNINNDRNIQKYLSFRDGYKQCDVSSARIINDELNERLIFEAVKSDALRSISNHLESWMATLPPQNGEVGGDLARVLSMCRLLAMTHRDYGGKATTILETVVNSNNPERYQFQVSSDEATSEGLEYRACHVLERLAGEMRSKIVKSIASLMPTENLEDVLNSNPSVQVVDALRRNLEASYIDPPSWKGTSILVRLGELETLTILCENARDHKQQLLLNKELRSANGTVVDEEDYIVRDSPCQ